MRLPVFLNSVSCHPFDRFNFKLTESYKTLIDYPFILQQYFESFYIRIL